ncbi:MAG: hypothetical protein JWN70_3234 [Planctomycetaceae bacterium]|nr:hypothetical protein [Planctomycetaceae bacterium]
MRHLRSCVFAVLVGLVAQPVMAADPQGVDTAKPIVLDKGVHLLLDDHLIASSVGVNRKVISPQRFLTDPVVTGGLEHQNWQPFITVLRDPATPSGKPFRMWYNVDAVDDPADGAYFGVTGYLESSDGIRWPGPYERLNSLTVDGRVRFGASVVDDGPRARTLTERYKMLYFDAGTLVGARVAFSPDGRQWTLHNGGKPVLPVNNGDDIWTAGFDPLRQRYFLIGKTYGPHSWTNAEGKQVTASIRRYFTSFSPDFKSWSEPKMVYSPDERDSGTTQWYGSAGLLVRGKLMISFLRVLRDDLSPEGVSAEAIEANTRGKAGLGASGFGAAGGSGMGYTVLTWTRDGETWNRDRHTGKFLEPDPRVGTWDHAMSWVGSSAEVGDEVYLYYAGYRWGHKYRHSVDRQLGLVKIKRDRYVARQAGEKKGTFTTPTVTVDGETLRLNVDSAKGEVRVQIANAAGEPIPGFGFQDCRPITTDSLAAEVAWARPLSTLLGKSVRMVVELSNARLFAFEVQ